MTARRPTANRRFCAAAFAMLGEGRTGEPETGRPEEVLSFVRLVAAFLTIRRRGETPTAHTLEALLRDRGSQPPTGGMLDQWLKFISGWCWSDEVASADAVTPDVISELFEGSLNRKALGAFYTAPDLAAYLCESAILPVFLARTLDSEMGALRGVQSVSLHEGVALHLRTALASAANLPLETDAERRVREHRRASLDEGCRREGEVRLDRVLSENVDLLRWCREWIREHVGAAELVRCWEVLRTLRILDPTCGSGAFLLAALDVMAALYEECVLRAEVLGIVLPGLSAAASAPRNELERLAIRENLFGVDLLDGAIEVLTLRFRLRLGRELSSEATGGLRAGNALVGWVDRSGDVDVLNRVLLDAYHQAGKLSDASTTDELRLRYRPLHWQAAFPEVMAAGGFDVVVGNPPYVGYAAGSRSELLGFATERCGDLYAAVMERGMQLLRPDGWLGMVVPVSSVSGDGFEPLSRMLLQGDCWVSTYSNRPAKLFPGVEQRIAVWVRGPASEAPQAHTSRYQHWYEVERPHLFAGLRYVPSTRWRESPFPAKLGDEREGAILRKIAAHTGKLGVLTGGDGGGVWLHDGPTYWIRALPFAPNTGSRDSAHYHRIGVAGTEVAYCLAAILSSTHFYLYFKAVSNCRDLTRRLWQEFPIDPVDRDRQIALTELGCRLEEKLRATARTRKRQYPRGEVVYEEYYPALAKDVLDEIDGELAGHYGLTPEELEYLRSYEGKYRLGRDANGG